MYSLSNGLAYDFYIRQWIKKNQDASVSKNILLRHINLSMSKFRNFITYCNKYENKDDVIKLNKYEVTNKKIERIEIKNLKVHAYICQINSIFKIYTVF